MLRQFLDAERVAIGSCRRYGGCAWSAVAVPEGAAEPGARNGARAGAAE